VDERLRLGFKSFLLKGFIPPACDDRTRPYDLHSGSKNRLHAVFAFSNLEFENLALDPALKSPSSPMMQQVMTMAANLLLGPLVLPVQKPRWSLQSSMAKPS
jgi:hypothetical protein